VPAAFLFTSSRSS